MSLVERAKLIRTYLKNLVEIPNRDGFNVTHKIRLGIKYYPAWKHSLGQSANALSDGVPWVTFEARDFIESILTPSAMVFEYGSGGSTLFYSRNVNKVVSVEHDPIWANTVGGSLTQAGLKNWECRLVQPDTSVKLNGSPDNPNAYCSSDAVHKGNSFRDYVRAIDSFPDQFFDFISVDGRARPSCILDARRKVKLGGFLMLDNSERPDYRRSKDLLSNWEMREFYGPGPYNNYFWETTIWKKIIDTSEDP